MNVPDALLLALLAAVAAFALATAVLWRLWRAALARGADVATRKQAQSARYGNLSEQFAPWMKGWPFDPEGFRFVGKPIDGVQVAEDAVYLVEIKSADSRRSAEQSRIRALVEAGRVGWFQFHVHEARASELLEPWKARARR